VTGIGSLPHRDPEEAVAFVAQFSPDIPFWPQLPQRSPAEGMIAQMISPLLDLVDELGPVRFEIKSNKLGDFCGRLREVEAVLDEHGAAGFLVFERACWENRFQNAVALKGQVSGPMTLGRCLFDDDSPLSTQPDMYADLVDYVCRLASWQISRLKQFGRPVILFIDEPMLALDSPAVYLTDGIKQLITAIHREGAYAGVHCCATFTPVSICSMHPDIVSFDAHWDLQAFISHPETRLFIESKGCLALGLVPTLDALELFSSSEAFVRWIIAATEYVNVRALAAQSMVTATCGLGLFSIEAAQASFLKAMELARLIGRVASC